MLMALLSEKGFCHQNAKKGSSATETVPNTKSLKKIWGGGVGWGGPKARFDFTQKRDYYMFS